LQTQALPAMTLSGHKEVKNSENSDSYDDSDSSSDENFSDI
jgi:hypothetical protein